MLLGITDSATVNHQGLTGGEPRQGRSEEESRMSDIRWLPSKSQGIGTDERLVCRNFNLRYRGRTSGVDASRRDGIDPDSQRP